MEATEIRHRQVSILSRLSHHALLLSSTTTCSFLYYLTTTVMHYQFGVCIILYICKDNAGMVVKAKIGFLFITILGQSVQCCECCEQSVQSRCGPVQCCPGRHPAVASVALWGTVQRYPGLFSWHKVC